jgi:hypothetical protein
MENCRNSYSFNHLNTGQQVHAEIDKGPVNTFFLVFLLFKNEHVMVEELLQLLVGEVNTQLFETVELFGGVRDVEANINKITRGQVFFLHNNL